MELGDVYRLPVLMIVGQLGLGSLQYKKTWQVFGDFQVELVSLLIDKHHQLSPTERSSVISGESS